MLYAKGSQITFLYRALDSMASIERSIAIMGSHGFTVLEVNHPYLKDLGSDF